MKKRELLALLRQDGYVSGAELGERLGVTRAAVSKAVAALKREGYDIESIPNRGHLLRREPDRLDVDTIREHLDGHPWAELVKLLPAVDSTNTRLKALAAAGAPEGTVIVAEEQSAGRGRLGRRFLSAPGCGVYLSALLRPACQPGALMSLTAQAAVATRRAVAEVCGIAPDVKWVNDLVLKRRKVCGILTELSLEAESGLVDYAVVGVGVNCNSPAEAFPPELQPVAGSVLSQAGIRVDRNALVAALVRALSGLPTLDWREEYKSACLNLGREVQLIAPGQAPRQGVALDVDESGALVVQTETGTESVQSGEVSVRGLYGYV